MIKIVPLETIEQQQVVNWLNAKELNFFAVPNGQIVMRELPRARQFRVLSHFKKEGVQPGVPDLMIVSKSPLKSKPVALEMKRAVGHRGECTCLSEDQKDWHKRLIQEGWIVIIAHGFEEAIKDLEALGY